MKKLPKSSIVFTVFSISMILFQFGCKKEATAQINTLTKEQILLAKTWKVAQLHHVISNTYSTYTNGGVNTTGINYDNLRFTFNSGGTGTHIDPSGNSHTMSWQFTTSDKRTLQLTLDNGSSSLWQMVQIADNYLNASVQLTISGNSNNIETFQLIQIP